MSVRQPASPVERVAGLVAAILARERLMLLLLLGLAAVLRLPGLESRGRFEFDQGQDMLVLRAFVQDGVVPLLGPKTSVGVFHHGALEYFLLAPSAWLSGAEPLAVMLEFALIGIAAVAVTWWLGRVIGGPTVGLVAGLLLAVSPAAVDESTFIWNPNPVPLFAALALGAAWRARQTGLARWWAIALTATAAVANLHILGAVFVPPILALLVADVWAARRAHDRAQDAPDRARVRAALRGAAVGLAAGVVIYLPLIVSELQTGFAEARAIGAYLAAGGGEQGAGLFDRLVVTAFRVVDWPFVGLVTEVPIASSLVFAVVVGLLAWLAVAGHARAGTAGRWIGGLVAWSILALAVAAPSLAKVVLGLPNDHYHSFLDPVLVVGVALASVTLARRAGWGRPARVARTVIAATLVGLVGLALWRQPGPDPNGGWPAARAAGGRVVDIVEADSGGRPASIAVVNLPDFEPATWISYPIVYAAGAASPVVGDPTAAAYVVLGCDRLFEVQLGATCGGPADADWLPRLVGSIAARLELVERFDLSPRVNVSVYRVAAR